GVVGAFGRQRRTGITTNVNAAVLRDRRSRCRQNGQVLAKLSWMLRPAPMRAPASCGNSEERIRRPLHLFEIMTFCGNTSVTCQHLQTTGQYTRKLRSRLTELPQPGWMPIPLIRIP